jgi:hypothetical protein
MKKPSILIVEDENIVARDIRARVIRQGYDVTDVVSSGEDAVTQAGANRPDLVLMDIKLAGAMDGVEAAETIRSRYDIPVVYLTAYADETTLQRAKVTEAFGYLLKPFEERELHITVEMALYKHQMERKIREHEEWLATTLRSIGDAVVSVDAERRISYMNPAAEILTGWLLHDARGKRVGEVLQTIDGGSVLRSRAGQEITVEMSAAPLADGAGTVVILRDITERRRLEDQLRQAQKMESIGTLASGVAHDFNNILNTVLGFAAQIQKYSDDAGRVKKYGHTIEKSATRGAELCQKLLSFARKSKRELVPTDVGEIVQEVAGLCRGTFPKTVEVIADVDSAFPSVLGDRGELYQVVLNLCVNARDAIVSHMAGGVGRLTIRARGIPAGTAHAGLPPERWAESWVELSVSDTGCGIPDKIRQKIFDPFFTTKQGGKGTGLGLSLVYNIVHNHKGILSLESREGAGTTFTVLLPALSQSHQQRSPALQVEAPSGGTETILVVDDEESMLDLARELLQEQGYRVLNAGNGRQAVEVFRNHGGPIALVLLDLMMPEMDGQRTLLELRKIDPQVPAIFCTGFMPDDVVRNLSPKDRKRIVQKPFDPRVLFTMIRQLVDESATEKEAARVRQ